MHTLQQLQNGELAGIKRLDLSCGLREFPSEIFDLADSLEILNLSGNALSSLPDDLPRLHKLRVIFCSDNQFTHVPEVLGKCAQLQMIGFKANQIQHLPAAALPPALRWLILTDNQLSQLPDALGHCSQLEKLMLAGNQLSALPDSLAGLHQLALLRISANQFTALPDWLFQLPRLAWLAYAGNPVSRRSHFPSCDTLNWDDLQLGELLGEGASGKIYHAQWCDKQFVAVKLYKGNVTSDGLPGCELAACVSVGAHPQLMPSLGIIADHPEATAGLVMPLIATHYVNLAAPPSLESCSRDVYAPDLRFSLPNALVMAARLASAVQHLHECGLTHGDLYAHNILWDGVDNVLLGDFGAATLSDDVRAQRLEVLAFAHLLAELLERTVDADERVLAAARQIQQLCAQPNVSQRPLFTEIAARLTELSQQRISPTADH
jgi:hypothetical protein